MLTGRLYSRVASSAGVIQVWPTRRVDACRAADV
jgi:hypothetical protein